MNWLIKNIGADKLKVLIQIISMILIFSILFLSIPYLYSLFLQKYYDPIVTSLIFCIPPAICIAFSLFCKSKYVAMAGNIIVFYWAYKSLDNEITNILDGNLFFMPAGVAEKMAFIGVMALASAAIVGHRTSKVGRVLAGKRDRSPRTTHGEARFAGPEELAAMNRTPCPPHRNPIILGRIGHVCLAARLAGLPAPAFSGGGDLLSWTGEGSMLVVAPSGAGKTASVVIPNLIACGASVIVLDVKGELYKITADQRRKSGHDVYQFAPFNEDDEEKTSSINVLDYINDGMLFDSDCVNIASSIVIMTRDGGSGSEIHFIQNARGIVAGIIALVVDSHRRDLWPFSKGPEEDDEKWPFTVAPQPSLPDVYDILAANPKHFDQLMQMIIADEDEVGQKLARDAAILWNRVGDEERGSFFSTLSRFIGSYRDPAVRAATTNSDFDLNKIVSKEKQTDLYINIPYYLLKQHSVLARTLIATCTNITIKSNKKGIINEVMFFLDEMPTIGGMDCILDKENETGALTIGRSAGLRIIGFVQSLSQIQSAYGELGMKTWSSVDCFMAFGIPKKDVENSKMISDMLGSFTVTIETSGASSNEDKGFIFDQNKGKSVNTQDIARKLLEPSEVGDLPHDAALVFIKSDDVKNNPILCKKILYYKDNDFKGLYNDIMIDSKFNGLKWNWRNK